MYWSFYLRKGVAYIPTTAKTEAGFWLAIEPVDVAPAHSVEELQRLLLKTIGRGNPVVQTPTRQDCPPPVMQRYCGMKSFSAFERTAALWAISVNVDSYVIYLATEFRPQGSMGRRRWAEDNAAIDHTHSRCCASGCRASDQRTKRVTCLARLRVAEQHRHRQTSW